MLRIRGLPENAESLVRIAVLTLSLTFFMLGLVFGALGAYVVELSTSSHLLTDVIVQDIFFGSTILFAAFAFLLSPTIINHGRKLVPIASTRPALLRTIEEISKSSEVPVPESFLSLGNRDDVFIYGLRSSHSRLIIGETYAQMLDPEELKAVLRHEIAHVSNRDIPYLSWAVSYSWSIKYWIVMVIAGYFVAGALAGLSTQRTILLIYGYAFFALPLGALVPFAALNSLSRIREALADIDACKQRESVPPLIRAIKSTALWHYVQSSLAEKRHAFLGVRFLSTPRLPPPIGKYLLMRHPTLRERVDSLKSLEPSMQLNPLFRPLETAIYAGVLAGLFVVLYNEAIINSAVGLWFIGLKISDDVLSILSYGGFFIPGILIGLTVGARNLSELIREPHTLGRYPSKEFRHLIERSLLACGAQILPILFFDTDFGIIERSALGYTPLGIAHLGFGAWGNAKYIGITELVTYYGLLTSASFLLSILVGLLIIVFRLRAENTVRKSTAPESQSILRSRT